MTFLPISGQSSTNVTAAASEFNHSAQVETTVVPSNEPTPTAPNVGSNLSSTGTILQRLNILKIGTTPGPAKN